MSMIHFNYIFVDSPTTHIQSSWLHPKDQQGTHYSSSKYWRDLARTLERGYFDGIFFADILSVEEEFALDIIAFGGGIPRHDPLAVIPLMADATRHIGFGVTLSTAGTPPHLAVRRLGTIDNLSGGRVGWNVVTSYQRGDFRALGLEPPPHELRYDQGDEYMEICFRLWDAFPREAIVADRSSGIFIDTSKIKKVEFSGKYFKCDTYPVVERSPQGRPLIFQAGSSGRGIRFAATHADAIFSLQPTISTMQKYLSEVGEATRKLGGRPDPKVFFGLQPFLGGTEDEAYKLFRSLREKIPVDAALNRLGGILGLDLRGWDVEKPLEDIKTQASQGLTAALKEWGRGESPSIREAAVQISMSSTMPHLIGTPEQVAERIEAIWRETGCYGFNLSPHASPQSALEFAEHVVPLLQRRGLMRTEYAGRTFRENINQA
jgi:FMN-dependent oxidoreductase (nitrilotriacetate monooxygenase family)